MAIETIDTTIPSTESPKTDADHHRDLKEHLESGTIPVDTSLGQAAIKSLHANGISVNLSTDPKPTNNPDTKATKTDAEIEKETTINCMVSYFEGCNALNDFKRFHNYISRDEIFDLLDINDDQSDATANEKNYLLMAIHNNVLERVKNHEFPGGRTGESDMSQLKHCLKTNYIIGLNQKIAEYIEEAGQKNNNIGQLHGVLAEYLIEAEPSDPNILKLENLNTRFNTQANLHTIGNIISGMRHEAAFKELVYEMPDGVIEVIETDNEFDSHGVDLILSVKLSKRGNPDGSPNFASAYDIQSDDFIEVELPVDIKSTKESATNELADQLNFTDRPDHWIMWSHIYQSDFRLAVDEDGLPELKYSSDKSPIYLNIQEQIAAMRKLGNTKYHEKGETFFPEYLDMRIDEIKHDILLGIQALELNN